MTLTIYQITEGELEIIEGGSPKSVYLNFAILLLSIAASFLMTLLTIKVECIYVFYIFIIIGGVGFIGGIFLLIL